MKQSEIKEKEKKSLGIYQKGSRKKLLLASIVFFLLLVLSIALLRSRDLETVVVNSAVHDFTSMNFSGAELEQNFNRPRNVEIAEDIAIPELPEIIENLQYVNRADVIGTIAIESIGLYLPIFYGATHTNLLAGAGTMFPQQRMGEGNYSLAGHHLVNSDLLFGPLLNVRVGTWIQLNDGMNIYTYRVTHTETVHMSQTSILDPTDTPTITLFTCDVPTNGTQFRFVVYGELIQTSDMENAHMIHSDGAGGNHISAAAALANSGLGFDQYVNTYIDFRSRALQAAGEGDLVVWILQVVGLSLIITIVGILLFIGIERKYSEIKRRNADRFINVE